MLARFLVVVFVMTATALIARVDAAGAVGIGGTCAGIAGLGCDAGLWCEIESGMCARADAEGRCVRVPQSCGLSYRPVCACGGRTYANDCSRERAKVQKAHDGSCR
jgi:hypothetical protein